MKTMSVEPQLEKVHNVEEMRTKKGLKQNPFQRWEDTMYLKAKEKPLENGSDNVKAGTYGVEQSGRISPSSRV